MTTELNMWNGKQYTEGYLTKSQPVYPKSAISLKTLKEKKKKILYGTLPTIMQIGNAVLHFFSSQLQKRKLWDITHLLLTNKQFQRTDVNKALKDNTILFCKLARRFTGIPHHS